MNKGNVLVIDDEDKLRALLSRIIRAEGYEVFEAIDCKSALIKLGQHDIDVVFCDVKLPDMNGVEFTRQIKLQFPLTEVILLTAYGNIPDGVQAIKYGAYDYIVKGDDNNKIVPLLSSAVDKVKSQKKTIKRVDKLEATHSFNTVIGTTRNIIEALQMARKVAASDMPVLLLGETGTGKEVFAQAIHNASNRAGKAFVAINCSSFNKELLESELFGYKQGAFTGAIKDKKGLLEEADNGTLFLDEIGDMPIETQAKLLRVLETSEFIKLGDTKTLKLNIRLLAATNKDLKKASDNGSFRLDLYFRINTFEICLPALRERRNDVKPLAIFFANKLAEKRHKNKLTFGEDFLQKLEDYDWPGNIRELKNVIERSVILSDSDELTIDSLPSELRQKNENNPGALSAFELASVEKLHIQKMLNYTQGNKAETARLLNIGLATLYRKIEQFGLL